jgi:hypothetical protein
MGISIWHGIDTNCSRLTCIHEQHFIHLFVMWVNPIRCYTRDPPPPPLDAPFEALHSPDRPNG